MKTITKHLFGFGPRTGYGQKLLLSSLLASLLMHSSPTLAAGSSEGAFEFAVIGDMPYDGNQREEFVRMTEEINTHDLAFVIHVGDFWFDGLVWKDTTKGLPPCSDEVFDDRLALTKEFRDPFIFVPGDNDWTDCHRAKPVAFDPLERLTKLRGMFFKGKQSLGQRTIGLERQSENSQFSEYSENVRWTFGDILFVTLHMVAGNNNQGRTPEMDDEYAARNEANLWWLQEAFQLAKRNDSAAVVVVSHANPQFGNTWPALMQNRYLLRGVGLSPPDVPRFTGFDDFLSALEHETLAFKKPVVYVHGDSHTFRVDKPLVGSTSRRSIENFTRVETFGYKDTHWIKVTVDPDTSNIFSFDQQIVESNLVEH